MRTTTTCAVILCAVAFFLVGSPATLADDRPAGAPTGKLEVLTAEPTADQAALRAVGTADLPDGALVHVSLWFEGTPGLYREVPVAGGKFEAILGPVRERVLPGPYTVRVEMRRRSQSAKVLEKLPAAGEGPPPAEKGCYFGDAKAEAAEREKVRKRLITTLSLLRRVYLALAQQASYTVEHSRILKVKHDGKIPGDKAGQLVRDWERFTSEYWEEFFTTVRYDYREFRKMVFIPYHPKAAAGIEGLIVAFDRWYGACAHDVYVEIGRPVPPKVASLRQFDQETMRARIEELVRQVQQDLDAHAEPWVLADIAIPEQGEIEGDRYVSKIAKFKIKKPGATWIFDTTLLSPSVRIRIRPSSAAVGAKDSGVIAVEIRDFPESEDPRDLIRLTEVLVGARWPGYKKVSARDLFADDETMPNGLRPGYDLVYTTEDQGSVFQIRDYVLFCRWNKRTYSVLCICPKEKWKEYEKDFQEVCKSFHVVDAPEPDLELPKPPR